MSAPEEPTPPARPASVPGPPPIDPLPPAVSPPVPQVPLGRPPGAADLAPPADAVGGTRGTPVAWLWGIAQWVLWPGLFLVGLALLARTGTGGMIFGIALSLVGVAIFRVLLGGHLKGGGAWFLSLVVGTATALFAFAGPGFIADQTAEQVQTRVVATQSSRCDLAEVDGTRTWTGVPCARGVGDRASEGDVLTLKVGGLFQREPYVLRPSDLDTMALIGLVGWVVGFPMRAWNLSAKFAGR